METYLTNNIDKFKILTGMNIVVKNEQTLIAPGVIFDGQMILKIGNLQFPFWIEGKRKFTEAILQRIRHMSLTYPNIVLIGELTEKEKNFIRKAKIGYIADQGDYYLPIEIQQQEFIPLKKAESFFEKKDVSLTSSKGMAQLVFTLLVDKLATSKTQREIAQNANLSLGIVNKYIDELENYGFIKNEKLSNFLRLLDYWIADFNRLILSRIKVGRFSLITKEETEKIRTKELILKNGFWSGAKAADILLGSEIPNQLIIYTDSPNEIIKELRLRPDPEGLINLRKKFWTFPWNEEKKGIVPLPLIYADLMISQDPRDHNAANIIQGKLYE